MASDEDDDAPSIRRPTKRRRKDPSSKCHGIPTTIRALLGHQARILRLGDYIQAIAPSLEFDLKEDPASNQHLNSLMRRLSNTVVSPTNHQDAIKPVFQKVTKPRVETSLLSIVDDVVWSLVVNKKQTQVRNALSQGYVVASETLSNQVTGCFMRPGVMSTHLNSNASFCKSSKLFRVLHAKVGDEIVRFLLLKTSIFVPHETTTTTTGNQQHNNYQLVCGPIPNGRPANATQPNTAGNKSRSHRYLKPHATINRQSMLGSDAFVPKVGLPKDHILNDDAPREQELLSRMIPINDTPSGRKRPKRWNRLKVMGIPICKDIIKGSKKCDYHRLLDRCCPMPDALKNRIHEGEKTLAPKDVATCCTPSGEVFAFLSKALRIVFPLRFWGSSHNLDTFLGVVQTFVNLRRREALPNKTLMNRTRVLDFTWLIGEGSSHKKRKLCRTAHEAATRLVTTVLRWVFNDFIVPLLRSNFISTESEFSGRRVLYYRKPTWALFRSLSLKHLKTKQYKEISAADVKERLQIQKTGCSRLRLLPKATGVRPIATLCKRDNSLLSDGKPAMCPIATDLKPAAKRRKVRHSSNLKPYASSAGSKLKSTNEILRDSLAVLQFEHQNNPQLFGGGLLGLHEFYPRWHEYVSNVQARAPLGKPVQSYFASVDIRRCYDNIVQDRLLELLNGILSEDNYAINRCSLLQSTPERSGIAKRQLKQVCPVETFDIIQRGGILQRSSRDGAVLLDEGTSSVAKKGELMELIREHLQSHVVVTSGRHRDVFLHQRKGIPQGSSLSCFLCNFYYGSLEQDVMGTDAQNQSTEGHVSLLVRIIDDFLLVTTNKALHKSFLQAMRRGNPSLGMTINQEKVFSSINLSLTNDDGTSYQVQRAPDAGLPWCGLLFDTESCGVKLDLSRLACGKAADSLTVARTRKEGEQLRIAMKSFVRPRCYPILFDPSINSRRNIDANFFDLMLICAVKTDAYVASGNMLNSSSRNVDFLLSCIADTILFSLQLIKSRHRMGVQQSTSAPHIDLTKAMALSLGWNAFLLIFQRRRYEWGLIARVKKKLQRCPHSPRVRLVLLERRDHVHVWML
ncbi:Telomerase reverse transcriptase [Seminavis robusta]|uniref:Telomerase reverse transcriptase n=1 Tax=Seminavis robusta TaxID=568900 RepID=A0A9N8EJT2_9STRA|nr:Telomerase reverse transcriptase [Seminavis robusta]|eukprot:Sro1100_g241260.1 Telomerase reverse transcriptase (1079) ;mRNA; f:12459-15695